MKIADNGDIALAATAINKVSPVHALFMCYVKEGGMARLEIFNTINVSSYEELKAIFKWYANMGDTLRAMAKKYGKNLDEELEK